MSLKNLILSSSVHTMECSLTIYRNSQKKEYSCLLSYRFWRISPKSFELHKYICHFLHQFLKSFQMKNESFKSEHKISWFCEKDWCFKKKSGIEKNPPFWKIQKVFLMDSKFGRHSYALLKFSVKKYARNLLKLA